MSIKNKLIVKYSSLDYHNEEEVYEEFILSFNPDYNYFIDTERLKNGKSIVYSVYKLL